MKKIFVDDIELKKRSLILSFFIIVIQSENHLIRIRDPILCFFERFFVLDNNEICLLFFN